MSKLEVPGFLDGPIIRLQVVWTETDPVREIEPGRILRIMSDRPGTVRWSTDRWKTFGEIVLEPADRGAESAAG